MQGPRRQGLRQQPDVTRALIVDVAEQLLRERPYRELSVDEVMRPTGYRRTVFYRHFAGLPELVLAVLDRVGPELLEINAEVAEAARREVTPEETRERYGRVVDYWRRNGRLLRAISDAAVYDRDIERILAEGRRQHVTLTAQALEARGVGEDPQQLARVLIAMNERYLLDTFGREPFSAEPRAAVEALSFVWRLTFVR